MSGPSTGNSIDPRRNRPHGSKRGVTGPAATTFGPELRAMFAPRPPLEFKAPVKKRAPLPITGFTDLLDEFERGPVPERVLEETPHQRQARKAKDKKEKHEAVLAERKAAWDPNKEGKFASDAYKTLFVGRLSYDVTEQKLRREFEQYGTIKDLTIIYDKDKEPRGYAFVEFEDEKHMQEAYKRGDARKIEGHRVVVDVERGRTVRNWTPRRLGGGIGGTRKGARHENDRNSGRAGSRSSSSSSSSSSSLTGAGAMPNMRPMKMRRRFDEFT